MAIQIYCTTCRSSYSLDEKKCTKCGTQFPRAKKYRVTVSLKGTRVNRIVDGLALARDVEAAIKADMLREQFDAKADKKADPAPRLDEVWEKYLVWAKENKKTWDDDQYHYARHIKPRFGCKRMDEITPFEIEKMKIEQGRQINKNGKPFAKQTIKHHLALLRRMFKLARKWDLYDGRNPFDQVDMPRVDNQVNEFLTDDEMGRLMKTLDEWSCKESALFVKFALFTGFRRSELFRLEWKDIDFQRGMITLRTPKGGKTQTVPVSQEALDVLRSVEVTTTNVFPGKDGRQRTDFKGPWLRIRKAAGLPSHYRLHGLRHHFASTLVSNGVDLAIVKELLTHRDIATTQRYAHLKPDVVMEAARKSGELIKPKGDNVGTVCHTVK